MTDRRAFLRAAGGAGLLLGSAPASYVWAQDKSITVTSLGGKWEQSIREHFVPVFKARTGADVKIVLGGPPQWMSQIEAQPNKPPLDGSDNSESLALSLRDKGMVLKLDTQTVPNLANTPALYREPFDNYGAGYSVTASGIFYNKDKIKNPPKTWAEFFQRAGDGEFGRSVILPDITYGWTPHLIWHYAVTQGGSIDNLDPAFKSLARLKPHVVKFWTTALEAERMILSREADIGMLWDGRCYAMIDSGATHIGFTRLDPSTLITTTPAQVVRGGNEKLAYEWVNTLLDPEPQLKYFKLINYVPTNTKVVIPADQMYKTVPAGKGVVPPYRELAKTAPRMLQRWNREIRA